jgi:hypothetical protein
VVEQRGVLGPYLDAVKRYRSGEFRQPPRPDASETQTSGAEAALRTEDARLKLMGILAQRGDLAVQDLQVAVGLPMTEFGAVLAACEKAGLVEVAGTPGTEVARLTEQGRALTSFQAS